MEVRCPPKKDTLRGQHLRTIHFATKDVVLMLSEEHTTRFHCTKPSLNRPTGCSNHSCPSIRIPVSPPMPAVTPPHVSGGRPGKPRRTEAAFFSIKDQVDPVNTDAMICYVVYLEFQNMGLVGKDIGRPSRKRWSSSSGLF